jgi:phage/plasmid-associated DNA primase
LMELFRRTLGELYVRKMPLSFITDQNRTGSANADPAMMELKNARMVYYSESDRNEKVNVAKVKEITGGESLSGRHLFKEQENFSANCNHIVTTNHRFIIETTEHAVWRRFMSYKFKICFKVKCDPNEPNERPRDPELIDKIKADKRYQEAFLSILIHYRSKLYALYGGQILRVPHPTIEKETEEYRQSEDIYQRFIMNNVYQYKGGGDLSMDDFITRFREYYRQEGGGVYNGKSDDLLSIFRNSLIQGSIRLVTGKYVLQGFYVPPHGEKAPEGAIVYHEWTKIAKANA